MDKTINFLNMPRKYYYNDGITVLRGVACIIIFLQHLCGWYLAGYPEKNFLFGKIIQKYTWITQPYGETNVAVIFFVVLSGYCVHRNGLREVNKESVVGFYKKRIVRVIPLYFVAIFMGIICWKLSANREFTNLCTATYSMKWSDILEKVVGWAVLFPKNYLNTYCGNAPLITVTIEIYLYILYPLILWLQKENKLFVLKSFLIIWLTVVMYTINNHMFSWWNNGSLIAFIPWWWIGVCANKECIYRQREKIVGLSILYIISAAILFEGIQNEYIFMMFLECKKILIALIFAIIIRHLDDNKRELKINTWGIKEIGIISFSVYCVHTPIVILMLSMDMDLISIIVTVGLISKLLYEIFERKGRGKRHNILK